MREKKSNYKGRIIVALDTPDLGFAKKLVRILKDEIKIFKVGSELMTAHGPRAVRTVLELGAEVFLDLKFHDIPNTVAQATRAAVRLGICMLNLHVAGGLQMMQEACIASADEARRNNLKPPKLLGVTLLTSLSDEEVHEEIGLPKSINRIAVQYAQLAQKAGLDGVVSSALEARKIKTQCGPNFLVVSPGIRPEWAGRDDQRRVLSPQEAFELGASYIVIGRPITEADDPGKAIRQISRSL